VSQGPDLPAGLQGEDPTEEDLLARGRSMAEFSRTRLEWLHTNPSPDREFTSRVEDYWNIVERFQLVQARLITEDAPDEVAWAAIAAIQADIRSCVARLQSRTVDLL
jgi:hypothetical protein